MSVGIYETIRTHVLSAAEAKELAVDVMAGLQQLRKAAAEMTVLASEADVKRYTMLLGQIAEHSQTIRYLKSVAAGHRNALYRCLIALPGADVRVQRGNGDVFTVRLLPDHFTVSIVKEEIPCDVSVPVGPI